MLELIRGLQSLGYDCKVAGPRGEIECELNRIGISYKSVSMAWWTVDTKSWKSPSEWIQRWHRFRLNRYTARVLADWVELEEIDILHTNSVVIPVGYMASKVSCVPHVWHVREFVDLDFGLRIDISSRRLQRIFVESDAVIAVSSAVAEHFQSKVGRIPHQVIHNGIAFTEVLNQRAKVDEFEKVRKFLLVGYVQETKGHATALEAISRLRSQFRDIELTIAGGGEITWLKQLVARQGLEANVNILGYQEELDWVYRKSQVALVCSRAEAFGRVTADAMSYGMPVIGNRSGGTPELIEKYVSGLLYDGSVEGLVEAMAYLIREPFLARRFGENGREKVRNSFSTEHCTGKIDAIYRRILRRSSIRTV